MNIKLLVDSIVRQTTVLIAQLSTNAGVRAPLAQLADQVFLSLARELDAQGVGRKVAADMFGLALRGYQKKMRRASASASIQDKTLFEAVLEWVEREGGGSRESLLERFRGDNEREVIGVVNELVHCGLLYSSGHGAGTLYGLTSDAERQRLTRTSDKEALANMALGAIYRCAGITRAELADKLNVTDVDLDAALVCLVADERISSQGEGLSARTFQIPVGAEYGWEAAVFDHFQAVATAIGTKVQLKGSNNPVANIVGGTTLRFEVSRSHPKLDQVLSLLAHVRNLTDEVWAEVAEHNAQHALPEDERLQVTFYFGQSIDDPTYTPRAS
jgi:hypothetical protein